MHKAFLLIDERDDNVAYICPKCFRGLSLKIVPLIHIFSDIHNDVEDLDACFVDPLLSITCKRCGEIMFRCDYSFASRIYDLNNFGLYTLSHCEGHAAKPANIDLHDLSSEYDMSNPYISFDWNRISEENHNLILSSISEASDCVYANDVTDGCITIYPITQDNHELDSYKDKLSYIDDIRTKLYKFVDILIQKAKYKMNNKGDKDI